VSYEHYALVRLSVNKFLYQWIILSVNAVKLSLCDISKVNEHQDEELVWGIEGKKSGFTLFSLSQLLEATSNFSDENKLGQGGFGPVYKVKNHSWVYTEN
jgi:hypothetical protein